MSDTPQHIAAELRRLSRKCEHYCNDPRAMMVQAAAVIEQMAEGLAQMTRERDELLRADSRWSEIVADELAESRRLMDLGRAKDDENFTTFAERVIAERDALRAEVERLRGALEQLAAAADAVGVSYFDTDDLPSGVVQMQSATIDARRVLQEPTP